jgi:ribose transport system substrate-binding protein
MNIKRLNTNLLSFFTMMITLLIIFSSLSANSVIAKEPSAKAERKLVYIVSDRRIPFWAIMGRGIKNAADSLGYELEIYSAENSAKRELELTIKAMKDNVSGIIVSPTNSSACVTLLKFAKSVNIPVVISDIGTDSGEYVSYISSNNKEGAYNIGQELAKKLFELGWEKGRVGIVAIPQKRLNGQARTAGFMQALNEVGIKGAGIKQQVNFTEEETYSLSKEIIIETPDLRAIWLQGSNLYKGALRAIADMGKQDEVLLITFDAEPEFLDLIPQGVIVGSAMQQPYLMGQEAVYAMDRHFNDQQVEKNQQLPVLSISAENIVEKLPIIKKMVLGIEN